MEENAWLSNEAAARTTQRQLVILMGLQGSGKSTFYRKFLEKDFVRVNLDTLKTRKRERELVKACLREGESFAVDNTNPTQADRARYISVAKLMGYKVIGFFMESKIKDCVARNALRQGAARIPAKAIAATSNKLEMPSRGEGFDELYFVHNDGETMRVSQWREAE